MAIASTMIVDAFSKEGKYQEAAKMWNEMHGKLYCFNVMLYNYITRPTIRGNLKSTGID